MPAGTIVTSGSLISPGGAQGLSGPPGATGPTGPPGSTGPSGENANTLTTSGFTVPPVGSSVSVSVVDAGWVSVGQMLYLDQAGGGANLSGALQVTAKTGNTLTLLNPPAPPATGPAITRVATSFVVPSSGSTVSATVVDASAIFLSDSLYFDNAGAGGQTFYVVNVSANTLGLRYDNVTAPDSGAGKTINAGTYLYKIGPVNEASASYMGLLGPLSGKTSDYVGGDNACHDLATGVSLVRQRAYNAVGNPNFEVNQRLRGTLSVPVGGSGQTGALLDRWQCNAFSTTSMTATYQIMSERVPIPGTTFTIAQNFVRITLTAQETTLGTSTYITLRQYIEAVRLRELISGVHSLSVLARSSVAGLNFSVALIDTGPTGGASQSAISGLGSLTAANTWTTVQIPNLPVFPPGQVISPGGTVPGGLSVYTLYIAVAAAPSYTPPANNVWATSGNAFGAVGMSNFAAAPVGSTFDIAFAQHEPGAICTPFIDLSFNQNLDECLRYYCKSYVHVTAPGSGGAQPQNEVFFNANNTSFALGYAPFPKPMARAPTSLTVYNSQTGTINQAQSYPAGVNTAITGSSVGDKAISYLTGTLVSGQMYRFHYTADTGL